ncbi:MAG: hypothetical protein IPK67_07105 [Planctomycetes bacterium]|nr:hypothetical protein [Planctomycetota bacterium]
MRLRARGPGAGSEPGRPGHSPWRPSWLPSGAHPNVGSGVGPLSAAGAISLAARFEAAQRHPELPELMRREPSVTRQMLGEGCSVAGLTLFTTLSSIGLLVFLTASRRSPLWVVPLFFVLLGLFLLAAATKRGSRIHAAPLARDLACVVDKRTEISGADSTTTTKYHATLERTDGQRTEYEVDGRVAGLMAQGDLGVAYTKAELLVDFQRLR